MQRPPTSDQLVQCSFVELGAITRWLEEHRKDDGVSPRAILVGGWAVYAYNSYFGSYDIDLVTNSDTKGSLMYYLRTERGFEKYKSPLTGEIGVIQIIPTGQLIHIDFATLDGHDTFEGTGERISMNELVSSARVIRPGGWWLPLPDRNALLIMKLKAAWDRQWRLEMEKSEDAGRDEEKLIKDLADILAIIDSEADTAPLDIDIIGRYLNDHPQLRGVLERVVVDRRGYDFYDRDAGPVRRKVENVLALTR